MLIFLIGMMGSGKTTLGKQLAAELNYPFVDLDEYIVQHEQRSIPAIFEEDGEAAFRQLEREALERLVHTQQQAVVATGGGLPCFFDNIAYLNQHGQSVFLDVPVNDLVERLSDSNLDDRPLLAGKSIAELNAYIANALIARHPFYSKASYIAKGSKITVAHLRQLLNKY